MHRTLALTLAILEYYVSVNNFIICLAYRDFSKLKLRIFGQTGSNFYKGSLKGIQKVSGLAGLCWPLFKDSHSPFFLFFSLIICGQ